MGESNLLIQDLRTIAGNSAVSGMGVEAIVGDLLKDNFREISLGNLELDIRFSLFGGYVGMQTSYDSLKGKSCIEGYLPRDLLLRDDFDLVLRGILGHELSHVIRGDHLTMEESIAWRLYDIGMRESLEGNREFLPIVMDEAKLRKFGEKYFRAMERACDEEAIKRGLGREVYCFRKYLEDVCERLDWGIAKGYYESEDIKNLIERNV